MAVVRLLRTDRQLRANGCGERCGAIAVCTSALILVALWPCLAGRAPGSLYSRDEAHATEAVLRMERLG
eukprot:4739568-Prymnesium_polylepis.2